MQRGLFMTVVFSALIAGCSGESGPKTVRVWGEVMLDGKPLPDGTIEFKADDGSHAAQGTITEGKYDIPAPSGPIEGKPCKVSITSLAKTGKSRPSIMPGSSDAMEELQNIIPPAYNSKTTLTATATPDNTHFDFKLEKGPGIKK